MVKVFNENITSALDEIAPIKTMNIRANRQIRCSIGKSAKNPSGIFGFFFVTAYLCVFIHHRKIQVVFNYKGVKVENNSVNFAQCSKCNLRTDLT